MAKLPVINKIANEIYEAACKKREEKRKYLGMSYLGHPCERMLWYDFRGYSPIPFEGQTLMIFQIGNVIEEISVKMLEDAGYPVTNRQDSFSIHAGWCRGHADGIVHNITQKKHILEIKSANDKKFKLFRDHGLEKTSPIYYAQMQMYMGCADIDRGLFFVYAKNTSEICTERIYFNESEFKKLCEKAYNIITADKKPEKGFTRSGSECAWCRYKNHCEDDMEAMQLEKDRMCGNCFYMTWRGLKAWCGHPDHAFQIKMWGIKCNEYSFEEEKNKSLIEKRKPLVIL